MIERPNIYNKIVIFKYKYSLMVIPFHSNFDISSSFYLMSNVIIINLS